MAASIVVIVNSQSGTGCPPDWLEQLERKFAEAGLPARIQLIEQGGDIAGHVAQAIREGAPMVVAGGGDGTVSAVAAGLVGTGVPLGVLPMGTLNHFAKDLGIPLEQDQAIAVLATGRLLAVDAGEVNGRIFINNSSLGLYPVIVRGREQRQRHLGHGKWRALLEASIAAARRYALLTVQIEVDGQTLTRRTPFVFVGNNEYSMEGFEIGEREQLDCGTLSLYLTQRMGRFDLLRLAVLALLRRLDGERDFDRLLAREFVVHTGKSRLRVATDGEITMMDTPLRYRVLPKALQVAVKQLESTQ